MYVVFSHVGEVMQNDDVFPNQSNGIFSLCLF